MSALAGRRVLAVARFVVIVAGTALVSGITGGLAARLAMRVVAMTDEEPGTLFTAGGTSGILLAGVVFGAIVAAVFTALRPGLPGSDLRKGLGVAAAMVLFPGLLVVLPEALGVGSPWLNVPMFLGVALAYGLATSLTAGWLERRIPPRAGR